MSNGALPKMQTSRSSLKGSDRREEAKVQNCNSEFSFELKPKPKLVCIPENSTKFFSDLRKTQSLNVSKKSEAPEKSCMYESQVTAAAMLIAFTILVVGLIFHITFWSKCYSMHSILQMLAVGLTGLGICIFRLLRGMRTNVVKYIHMAILVLAFALMMFGMRSEKAAIPDKEHAHSLVAYISMGIYLAQIVIGFFFFTYLYEYRTLRINLAPIHDVTGVFIYLTLVGVIFSGHHGISSIEYIYTFHAKVFVTVGTFTFLIAFVIVISPYFEWELVGFL